MSQEQPTHQPPIAIVGLGGIFPGAADLRSFWTHILNKSDLITDVPQSHWSVQDYYDENPKKADHTYCRRGGFLPEIPFDSLRYGIPPNLLSQTDTSQLLGLLVARTTLDEATRGQLENIDRSRISVLLGVTSGQELFGQMAQRLSHPHWRAGMEAAGIGPEDIENAMGKIADSMTPWTEATFPGLLGNVVAGRIANRLDLGGTNAVTDAACASSLAAISMAVDELVLGRADVVLSGGVDTLNDIFMYMCFSKTPALSPSGECRPFDADADGTLLGEGIGMLALKRLSDAERDGDAIYAVIRGVGTSSDGRSKSVYAPVSAGQAKALRRAYESAQYGPRTVELVEAHGTGTKAGDVAEVGGLKDVFGGVESNDGRPWAALGSVKSQIGHTKAAAGAAGLLKAALALHHKVLPPTAKVNTPNPKLGIEGSPFYLNTEARPWVRGSDHPRRASVSALGFGGSNFHVTLEEYSGTGARAPRFLNRPAELFPLSATTNETLRQSVEELLAASADTDKSPESFGRLARQTQEGFAARNDKRIALCATSPADLRHKLEQVLEGWGQTAPTTSKVPGVFVGEGVPEGKMAFLFPGQGSQYVNMGRSAAIHFDAVRQVFDRSADVMLDGTPIADCVFPPPAFDDDRARQQNEELTRTENAQPALGTLEAGLLAQLTELSLHPDVVGGHSFGEVTALYAADVFDLSSLIHIARRRGELMAESGEVAGSMAAVIGDLQQTRALLSELNLSGLVLANENAPKQGVISGPEAEVEQAIEALEKAGLGTKKLNVATAFHSSLVAPASPALLDFLEDVSFSEAQTPVYGNSEADLYPQDADAARIMLAEQLSRPVRFVSQIEKMYEAGVRTFVEVGPNSILTRLTRQILQDKPHLAVETDNPGKDGVISLTNALAQLCAAGYEMRLEALWADTALETDKAGAKKPALLVSLSGANYGKPEMPSPAPQAKPIPAPQPVPRAAPAGEEATSKAYSLQVSEPPMTQNKMPVAPPPVAQPAAPSPQVGGWLEVFRQTQQQSAEAHATFQRTMAEAHLAYLRAFEASAAHMSALLSGQPMVAPPQPSLPAMAPAMPLAPHSNPVPMTAAVPPVNIPVAASPATPPMQAATSVAPVANGASTAPALSPLPVAAPAATGLSLRETLWEVVAEKTGYPLEALEEDMALEADLGVDSIKRVEILGALKERVPALPDLDAMQMAQLSTLGEIARGLDFEAPTGPGNTQSPSLAPAAAPQKDAAPLTGGDLNKVFLDVVAEKTGYPVEALQLDMNLEADLGVDSIKRVEILGALKERVPELPELDAMQMAKLATLGEIAAALGSNPAAAAPPAGGEAPAGEADLTDAFLAVVADKTGYPVEALQLDMNLEADLGVDSIKRVEILGALKERVPNLPELDAMQMSKLSTLAEIADALRPAQAPSNGTPKNGASTHGNGVLPPFERGAIERAELSIAPLRHAGAPLAIEPAGTIGLVAHDCAFAPDFAARLEKRGYRVVSLTSPQDALPADELTGLFLLGTAQSASTEAQALELVRQAFDMTRVHAASLQSAAKRRKVALVSVQDTGGRFGTTLNDRSQALLGGIAGLVKSAAQEWPDVATKVIDIDVQSFSSESVITALETEIFEASAAQEVGLGDGERVHPVLKTVRVPSQSASVLPPDAVIVATGGARGVTATALEALCRKSRPALVLLGRTDIDSPLPASCEGLTEEAAVKRALFEGAKMRGEKLSPADMGREAKRILAVQEIRAQLAAYRDLGSKVLYYAVDVRDADALHAALEDARDRLGPISGLVHGAGVLADRRIEDKTLEQYDWVLDTKVGGLLALLDATRHDPLKVISLFSSVAGRFGNIGQSDYAIANEMLNKVAQTEYATRGEKCLVKSMNWGPWAGGMVTPALTKQFAERGVSLLSMEDGARFFVDELSSSVPRASVEAVFGGPLASPQNTADAAWAHESQSWVGAVHLNASQQPWMEDHSILGVPVLPAVFAAELMIEIAQQACPGRVVSEVRDLRVLRGLKLDRFESGGHDIHIELRADSPDSQELSVQLRTPGELAPRYAAKLVLAVRRDKGIEPQDNSPAVTAYDMEASSVYHERLFHGPRFQLLDEIVGVSDESMVARARGVRDAGWPAGGMLGTGWQSDAALLDAGLQLVLLYARHRHNAAFLPTGFNALSLYEGSEGLDRTQVRVIATSVTNDRIVCDIEFIDADGRVVMRMSGATVHRLLDDAAFSAQPADAEVRVS